MSNISSDQNERENVEYVESDWAEAQVRVQKTTEPPMRFYLFIISCMSLTVPKSMETLFRGGSLLNMLD